MSTSGNKQNHINFNKHFHILTTCTTKDKKKVCYTMNLLHCIEKSPETPSATKLFHHQHDLWRYQRSNWGTKIWSDLPSDTKEIDVKRKYLKSRGWKKSKVFLSCACICVCIPLQCLSHIYLLLCQLVCPSLIQSLCQSVFPVSMLMSYCFLFVSQSLSLFPDLSV